MGGNFPNVGVAGDEREVAESEAPSHRLWFIHSSAESHFCSLWCSEDTDLCLPWKVSLAPRNSLLVLWGRRSCEGGLGRRNPGTPPTCVNRREISVGSEELVHSTMALRKT